MNETKKITLRLTENNYNYIYDKATESGKSLNKYICETLCSTKPVNSLPEAKARSLLAILYALAEQEECVPARKKIREAADALWQCLK